MYRIKTTKCSGASRQCDSLADGFIKAGSIITIQYAVFYRFQSFATHRHSECLIFSYLQTAAPFSTEVQLDPRTQFFRYYSILSRSKLSAVWRVVWPPLTFVDLRWPLRSLQEVLMPRATTAPVQRESGFRSRGTPRGIRSVRQRRSVSALLGSVWLDGRSGSVTITDREFSVSNCL